MAGHLKPVGSPRFAEFVLEDLHQQRVLSEGATVLSPKAHACTIHPIDPVDPVMGRRPGMARERQPETEFRAHHIGLERLRECIERVLLSSDVQYGVRFDNDSAGGEFAYSWAAICSKN